MRIDWKYLATTDGYKSLKAAYVRDVQKSAKFKRPMRDKVEFLTQFRWVIGRAKHYAHHTGRSMESILNEWEENRAYWWLNYYQDCRQPKFHSGARLPAWTDNTNFKVKNRWSKAKKNRQARRNQFLLNL